MIIYNYDPITFEYTGYSQADLDPAETKAQGKEVYLIPANATTIKPPKTKANETATFCSGSWQIKADYRGQYIVDETMQPQIVEQIGNLPNGFIPITEKQAQKIQEDDLYYVISDGKLIKNPDYDKQKKEREDKEFNSQFFNTSLGYVRRKVSMQDGTTRDFLSDILPLLEVGVPILSYSRELEQTKAQVTEDFLNECKQQLLTDFYGG